MGGGGRQQNEYKVWGTGGLLRRGVKQSGEAPVRAEREVMSAWVPGAGQRAPGGGKMWGGGGRGWGEGMEIASF